MLIFLLAGIFSGCSHPTDRPTGSPKLVTTWAPNASVSTAVARSNASNSSVPHDPGSNYSAPSTIQGEIPISSWKVPPRPSQPSCGGLRLGVYSWDASYWLSGNSALLDFLDSETGRLYNCGDVYVNVGDYSSADQIASPASLKDFAMNFRLRVSDAATVLYFTYGDVTARDGEAMLRFTEVFFDWLDTFSAQDALRVGKIGISYDVEHMSPSYTERVLLLCQARRRATAFGDKNLLIQYVIEGDENVKGTDMAFKYADSVLAMLYSNFVSKTTSSGATHSLDAQLQWFLTTQCPKCLQDDYAKLNYKAKLSIMVEGSCQMGRSCSWASFCAYDRPGEGIFYLERTLQELVDFIPFAMTEEKFNRLFNYQSMFVVNSFEWYRCYQPFNNIFNYTGCSEYHTLAKSCREK